MIEVVGCGYVVWGKLNQAEAASGIDKDEIGLSIDEQAKAKAEARRTDQGWVVFCIQEVHRNAEKGLCASQR